MAGQISRRCKKHRALNGRFIDSCSVRVAAAQGRNSVGLSGGTPVHPVRDVAHVTGKDELRFFVGDDIAVFIFDEAGLPRADSSRQAALQ